MTLRLPILALCLIATLVALAPDLDAQRRGGRKGGRRGGNKSARLFLPKPLPPIKIPKPSTLPPSATRPQTSLLPDASAPPVDGGIPGTDISLEKDRSVVFWTDPRDPELEEYYFQLCDHDENNWISFRESAYSLRHSRQEFATYDTDRDGRIQREEFAARYSLVIDNQGDFAPPKARIEDYFSAGNAVSGALGSEFEPTDESRVLDRFDLNGSAAIELGELPPLIEFWRLSVHITPPQVLEAIDEDLSSALELAEMSALIDVLKIAQKKFNGAVLSLDELSGLSPEIDLQPEERSSIASIDRSKAPTVHFDRLDQNGDRFIDTEDLRLLQSPMQLSVRTNAVIAAIDADGDGKVSEAEFAAAFE